MRAYFFGNMYLSSIQQGIQAAHVLHEMFVHCSTLTQDGSEYLWEWAKCHKTMILLNAGYGEEIRNLTAFFNNSNNPYPWAAFHESRDALDGALTSIGIILPEKIYETARIIRSERRSTEDAFCADNISVFDLIARDGKVTIFPENRLGIETAKPLTWEFSKWEFDLTKRLNNYGLAK